jgi:hypothetical protein
MEREDAPDAFRLWFLPFVDPSVDNTLLLSPLSLFDDVGSTRWGDGVGFVFIPSVIESAALATSGGDDAEEDERDLVKACLKVSIWP